MQSGRWRVNEDGVPGDTLGWRGSIRGSRPEGKMLLEGNIRAVDHFAGGGVPEIVAWAIRIGTKVSTRLGPGSKLATSEAASRSGKENMTQAPPDTEFGAI